MTNIISEELALILNLRTIAIDHKETCKNPECNVSLYHLKLAAKLIRDKMIAMNINRDEIKEANLLIGNDWPI